MLTKTYTVAVNGLETTTITIEVNITKGIQFHMTGLPDSAVKESYDRIKSAASDANQPLATYIKSAIRAKMESESV